MPEPPLVVWYNTRCPVCAAATIASATGCWPQRRGERLRSAILRNLEPDALLTYGVSLEDIRRRLHATDGSGHLLIGADVAIAVWRLTPGERWLATLAGNPVVRPITRVVYDRFADLLYAWNRRKGRW
jgi:predicted DCC family thiol-disulfide oxidoreductase YuxK